MTHVDNDIIRMKFPISKLNNIQDVTLKNRGLAATLSNPAPEQSLL